MLPITWLGHIQYNDIEEESIFSFATTTERFNKRTNKKDLIASHSYARKTKNKGHPEFMKDCQLSEDVKEL